MTPRTEAEAAVIAAARQLLSAFAAAEAEHGQFSTRSIYAKALSDAIDRLDAMSGSAPR